MWIANSEGLALHDFELMRLGKRPPGRSPLGLAGMASVVIQCAVSYAFIRVETMRVAHIRKGATGR